MTLCRSKMDPRPPKNGSEAIDITPIKNGSEAERTANQNWLTFYGRTETRYQHKKRPIWRKLLENERHKKKQILKLKRKKTISKITKMFSEGEKGRTWPTLSFPTHSSKLFCLFCGELVAFVPFKRGGKSTGGRFVSGQKSRYTFFPLPLPLVSSL